LDELDEKTLESKKVKNLYFGGELLDVDGDRGGYNLHFAFACGYTIGKHLS
jgi:predicted flavoprotein YhiN